MTHPPATPLVTALLYLLRSAAVVILYSQYMRYAATDKATTHFDAIPVHRRT